MMKCVLGRYLVAALAILACGSLEAPRKKGKGRRSAAVQMTSVARAGAGGLAEEGDESFVFSGAAVGEGLGRGSLSSEKLAEATLRFFNLVTRKSGFSSTSLYEALVFRVRVVCHERGLIGLSEAERNVFNLEKAFLVDGLERKYRSMFSHYKEILVPMMSTLYSLARRSGTEARALSIFYDFREVFQMVIAGMIDVEEEDHFAHDLLVVDRALEKIFNEHKREKLEDLPSMETYLNCITYAFAFVKNDAESNELYRKKTGWGIKPEYKKKAQDMLKRLDEVVKRFKALTEVVEREEQEEREAALAEMARNEEAQRVKHARRRNALSALVKKFRSLRSSAAAELLTRVPRKQAQHIEAEIFGAAGDAEVYSGEHEETDAEVAAFAARLEGK